MLNELITKYLEAQRVWEAQFDEDEDLAGDSPEWKTYMKQSANIIDYECATMQEVHERARFMLSQENLVDLLANCSTYAAVTDFLKSMTGSVDKSNNGEKSS